MTNEIQKYKPKAAMLSHRIKHTGRRTAFRQSILCTLLYGLCLILLSCMHDIMEPSEEDNLRQIAWNAITAGEQETILHDKQEAKVTYGQYQGRSAAFVEFRTSLDELLGPITIIIDRDSRKVIGQFLRD